MCLRSVRWTQNDFCSSQMFWKHWMKLWNCIRVQKSLEEINQLTHGQIPSTLIILGQTGGITCHTTKSSQMELTIFTWLQKWWTNNELGEKILLFPLFSSSLIAIVNTTISYFDTTFFHETFILFTIDKHTSFFNLLSSSLRHQNSLAILDHYAK